MNNLSKETKSHYIYDISFFLLVFIALTVVITSLLLFTGITVTCANIVVSLMLAVFIQTTIKKSVKESLKIAGISILILFVCIGASKYVYDFTWDGAAYHKTAIGLLEGGWNPVYQSASNYNNLSKSIPYNPEGPLRWADAYPKASWYFSASVYSVTKNIESGKAYTLLFMLIVFGFFYDYAISKKLTVWQARIISSIAAFNPVAVAQCQSFYVDGMLTCILMMEMLLFIEYFDEEYLQPKKTWLISMSCLIILGCNLKFSGLLFTVLYCFVFFVMLCIYKSGNINTIIKKVSFLVGSGVVSLFIVGFAPYITNILRYKNMFYGIIGNETLVSTDSLDKISKLTGLNNPEKFLVSIFSKMSHYGKENIMDTLKIPFTVFKDELPMYNLVDTRLGGFGVLFSGIFLISLGIVIYAIYKNRKSRKPVFMISFVFLLSNMLIMPILPATFNARYIGQLYILPVVAIVLLFFSFEANKEAKKKSKYIIISSILIIAILINLSPWSYVLTKRIKVSADTTAVFRNLAQNGTKENTKIAIWLSDFSGINYNLKDFNLKYQLIPFEKIDGTYGHTFADWVYFKNSNNN